MTTFIDIDLQEPDKILYIHDKPILDVGKPGAFDEHGIMPSYVCEHLGQIWLYYAGWSRRESIRYSNWTGLAVSEDGGIYLRNLLFQQRHLGPRSHVERFKIVKGDAVKKLPAYLDAHPETVCSLAYFDFDIYKPTKECLALMRQVLTRGSILVFDQLTYELFPGETIAVKEVLGLKNHRFHKDSRVPYATYVVIG